MRSHCPFRSGYLASSNASAPAEEMTSAAAMAITRALFIGVLFTINRKDLMLTLLFLMITRRRHSQPCQGHLHHPRRPSRLSETVKARLAYSALILAARMTLAQFSISTLMRVANSSGVLPIGS